MYDRSEESGKCENTDSEKDAKPRPMRFLVPHLAQVVVTGSHQNVVEHLLSNSSSNISVEYFILRAHPIVKNGGGSADN